MYHLALRNGPFGVAKQAVLECKTARFSKPLTLNDFQSQ